MQFAFTEEQELLRREARRAPERRLEPRGDRLRRAQLRRPGRPPRGGRARERRRVALRREPPEDERLATLALEAVGIGKKALDLAIEYAQNREQFGRKIGVYQAVRTSWPTRSSRRSCALTRVLGRLVVAEGDGEPGADRGSRRSQGLRRRRRGSSVRALDPGARRHRLPGSTCSTSTTSGRLDPGVAVTDARTQAKIAAWLLELMKPRS